MNLLTKFRCVIPDWQSPGVVAFSPACQSAWQDPEDDAWGSAIYSCFTIYYAIDFKEIKKIILSFLGVIYVSTLFERNQHSKPIVQANNIDIELSF